MLRWKLKSNTNLRICFPSCNFKVWAIWNQSKIDQGQEFSLCLFVQDLLKNDCQSTEKEPWKQTTFTQNVIERFWPELNSRVNYLVKRALISIIY